MARTVLAAMRLMPALGFALLALGWTSMVLLGHFPASEWAWRLTLLANAQMANLFYYSEKILPLAVPGQIALCLGIAALFVLAAWRKWVRTGFLLAHTAGLALFFNMVQVDTQSASLTGSAADPMIGLQPDATAGSLLIFALIGAGCLAAHLDIIEKGLRRQAA